MSEQQETQEVNHPPHYLSTSKCAKCAEPIECIDITRQMGFNLGNAIKYIWRCEHKGNKIKDLKKAIWYLNDEIKKHEEKPNEAT